MQKRLVIDDSELAIPHFSPVCTFCAHWDADKTRQCAAYPQPKGIPMRLWRGTVRHITPLGDEMKGSDGKSIVFAPIQGAKLPAAVKKAFEAAHRDE